MKRFWITLLFIGSLIVPAVATTLPLSGTLVPPDHPYLQYMGRVSFKNPQAPAFDYPGVQIRAAFEGTSLKMYAKPMSGFFMVTIDRSEPFKVSFNSPTDSVVTLAIALKDTVHTVCIMNCIEAYQRRPLFKGLLLDPGKELVAPSPLPDRKIEFIGNSITCGYGVESTDKTDSFADETENHYYTYAAITACNLQAQHYVVARSGIGIYRNYNGPLEGSPDCMPACYNRTLFGDSTERWDFSRYTPDVVCINLGTNDVSTSGCDPDRLYRAYADFLTTVRRHYPEAKIVLLTGCMLRGKSLSIVTTALDRLAREHHQAGDHEVYRFDMTSQSGSLGYGAGWHPSLLQQQHMADELTPFLRELMGWE